MERERVGVQRGRAIGRGETQEGVESLCNGGIRNLFQQELGEDYVGK